MVLESCMILLDNSEHMRNGDYIPTRLEAQHDAANFLIGRKTQSNPENTVGMIAMSSSSAAAGAELLVSPTDDMGKILSALHDVSITSTTGIDLTVSIQVASLALKHRRNKNGSQRIVVFVGSPLPKTVDSKALSKAGRMLKKNNVAIDIVVMGEVSDNQDRLKELVDAANGNTANADPDRMCHLVTIPAGVLPSDVLLSSPIVSGGGMGMSGGSGVGASGGDMDVGGASGGFADYGGIDPNMDPELAMALRVSMEEERARQERIAAASAAEETKQDTTTTTATSSENAAGDGVGDGNGDDADEDALLQQALAMSMAEGGDEEGVEVAATAEKMEVVQENVEIDDDDEDAAIQLALQMSMQPDTDDTPPAATTESTSESQQQQFQDPAFVNQLLGSLPGVDPNDPSIQNALRNLNQGEEKNESSDDKKMEDSSSKDKKEDS